MPKLYSNRIYDLKNDQFLIFNAQTTENCEGHVTGETQVFKSQVKVWFTVHVTCHFMTEEEGKKRSWMNHKGENAGGVQCIQSYFYPTPGLSTTFDGHGSHGSMWSAETGPGGFSQVFKINKKGSPITFFHPITFFS